MNKSSNSKNTKNLIFFAYKGQRTGEADDNVDSIKRAIREFNQHQQRYLARSWEDYRKTTAISMDVLNAIDKCEALVADLTYFNHNVLFELGYGIAKNKKILIILNEHIQLDGGESAGQKYKNFTLKDLRYTPFTNYKNIHEALQNKLYEGDLLDRLVNVKNIKPMSTDIFYIASKIPNQASLDLTNMVQEFKDEKQLLLMSDDSTEVKYQTLKWYLQNLIAAKATIIHFLGEKIENAFTENAQNSLFAGLAWGRRGRDVLLVAPAKYAPPLDYHDILVQYTSSDDLVSNVIDWLSDRFKQVITKKEVITGKEHEVNLIKLGIGCDIAELERQSLLNYFVYTGSYQAALNYEKTLLVGRKGSGKTAIYIKLSNELPFDFKNYVVKLQPESDELLDDVNLAQLYASSRRSFFSAVWQLVIFSKLANTINEKLKTDLSA